MAKKSNSAEIHVTRVYDASVKDVWEAWTDPKKAAKWWGPRGFTITTHSKDLRPGGVWHYTMHGPDGVDYPNKTKYFEVEKYSKLVYDHGANDDQPALFKVTVLFSEAKGKTTMAMTMTLPTPEAAAETKKFIKLAGGNATWDRLAEHLAQEEAGHVRFVINRSFEAPIETVFAMWTNPQHLLRWLPPIGFSMKSLRADVNSGKSSFFSMEDGAGLKVFVRMNYQAITSPTQIVYTQQFMDEHEKLSRHPFAPAWPTSLRNTVTFTDEPDNSTRVTVEIGIDGNATPEEIAAFAAERVGMTQGWSGSFDKLEQILEE